MTEPSGNPRVTLGRFLLLFVASRLLYIVLTHPSYLVFFPKELYRGTIAQELLTGLTLPFTEYPADNYALGSLVIGALAAGFFLLFGPTLFALKLAPLLLFTLALALWYWTILRYAGQRVAGYFAVLFCFSPPLLTAYSVTAMGFHSESIVFSALTVFLLFRMLSEEKPSLAYPVLLGLTAGFGLWFAYIYGLTFLATLVFWFWHDAGVLRRARVLGFALGFLVGFSSWIVMNLQTHFAGLVISDKNVWEHFRFEHLWEGLFHPRKLAPIDFLASLASDDSRDPYRRAANLLYSLLFFVPILTAGVLHLKTRRSAPAGSRLTQPTLVGFGALYVILFALAVQLSDFKDARYYLPAYPFLFFFVAHSLARCQGAFPVIQKKIQTTFLASVVVLGLGTHAPLLSLDRPGFALSAKGYSYFSMPFIYWDSHSLNGRDDPEVTLELVQRPFLSAILPKLSSADQQDLSHAIALLLADAAPLNAQAEDFAQFERLVPPGFDRHFYYWLGLTAMSRHPNELPKAVAAVEFLHHRSPQAHHLALVGIYRQWPRAAALDRPPEALVPRTSVTPAMFCHYWRALGHLASRSWYDNDRSMSLLSARLQEFVPRLDPSAQRSFLQGVGRALFYPLTMTPWALAAELEHFSQAYQVGLLEGLGMALGEFEFLNPFYSTGHERLSWMASTKGLSARSVLSVQRGKAQFDALFDGAASVSRRREL